MEKKTIDPRKIVIRNFKIAGASVDCPEEFDRYSIASFTSDVTLETGCNLDENFIKAVLSVGIGTVSGEKVDEASASFKLVFMYHYEDLRSHAALLPQGVDWNPYLANAIASITYSTARGILMTRLQDTPFQDFILPVVDPYDFVPRSSRGE